MEKIEPGKYVEMVYDLYQVDENGTETLVHQTDPQDPEKIVFGVTRGMIMPLEKEIEGLSKGGKFDITVKAAEAFGPYDPEQIAELERDIFIVDGKFDEEMIHAGAVVPMMTADGYRINGLVKEVTADKVMMDFNHPLAGKDVRFKGEITEVHEATPEELKPFTGGCSCGCDHSNCGDGCGDSCGSGCGDGCCH